jgi:hypothetical protein
MLFDFIFTSTFSLDILFLVAQIMNLISDGIVLRFAVVLAYHRCNIIFKGGEEGILITWCFINRFNNDFLNCTLLNSSGISEESGVFKPAGAAPDDGFLATVVPVDPAEYFATIAAENNLRKAMGTAKSSILATGAGVNDSATDKLFLDLHEKFTRDDSFMIVFT